MFSFFFLRNENSVTGQTLPSGKIFSTSVHTKRKPIGLPCFSYFLSNDGLGWSFVTNLKKGNKLI